MGDTFLSLNLNTVPQEDIKGPHEFNEEDREFQGDVDCSGSRIPMNNEEESTLMEQLKRMRSENKKLTEMLLFVCENYNNSTRGCSQSADLLSEDDSDSKSSKKRKGSGVHENLGIGNNGNTTHEITSSCCTTDIGGAGCCKRPREIIKTSSVSKVYAKSPPSDTTLVVKDGYQWRKYGQKVTRDNPSPRAYFKCSFAPNCPVKKKVQRSVEDPSLVVAIYEGEHNHIPPNFQAEVPLVFNHLAGMIPCSLSSPNHTSSSSPRPNLNPNPNRNCPDSMLDPIRPGVDVSAFQQLLVEKMADSLTRNPSFTASLAAAISTRILDPDLIERCFMESWENPS